LLYSVYSIPNIFLPLISGIIISKFGVELLAIILSVIIVFGYSLFCLGTSNQDMQLMIIGNIVLLINLKVELYLG